MPRQCVAFAIFAFLLSGNSAFAVPITWSRAVEMVKQNNADLKAAEATFRAAQAQVGVARSGFLPQVNGELAFSRSNRGDSEGGGDGTYSATLSGSQNLFAGGVDYAKTKQALANTEAARAALTITRAKISYELTQAFEGAVYAREYRKLTEEIIRRRNENLRLVQLRFQSGRENQGSVLLSKAYLEQAKYEDLQARNLERVAQAQLARALGNEGEVFEVSGAVPVAEPGTVPSFTDLVLTTPDYLQAAAQEEAKEYAVTAARSGFFPSLAVSGSTGDTGGNFYPHEREQWSVGVKLTLPLFNGGKDYYSTRAASQEAVSAAAAAVNVRRQTAVKLEQAFAAYLEAVSRLKVDHSFRDATQIRAEIARKKYNNGLMTFDDWDVIENDLINREKSYKQSQRDRVLAEASWMQSLGKGVLE